jgi:hypothetical protein
VTAECQHCGAPWRPDLTGSCRYCKTAAPPPGSPAPWATDELDATALYGRLQRGRAGGELGSSLRQALGARVSSADDPLTVTVEDWQYELAGGHATAIHSVRGVVLKREPMEPDEWLAALAAHLAEYAGKNAEVREGLLALEKGS